jgi:hypothetical protein
VKVLVTQAHLNAALAQEGTKSAAKCCPIWQAIMQLVPLAEGEELLVGGRTVTVYDQGHYIKSMAILPDKAQNFISAWDSRETMPPIPKVPFEFELPERWWARSVG